MAMSLKFFDFETYNADEEDALNSFPYDISWLVPNKILSFSGPTSNEEAELMSDKLKELNVGTIIRLNQKFYDKMIFIDRSIRHIDMYIADGSVPS